MARDAEGARRGAGRRPADRGARRDARAGRGQPTTSTPRWPSRSRRPASIMRSSSAKRWRRSRKRLAARSKWRMCPTRRPRSIALRGDRRRATRCSSRDRTRSDLPPSSRRWRAGRQTDVSLDRRTARLSRASSTSSATSPSAPARRSATALFIGLLIGPKFIGWLRVRQGKGQPIRDDGPQTHLAKRGTPTMGGLMILTSLTVVDAAVDGLLATAISGPACSITARLRRDRLPRRLRQGHEAQPQGRVRPGAAARRVRRRRHRRWLDHHARATATELYIPFYNGPVDRSRAVLYRCSPPS